MSTPTRTTLAATLASAALCAPLANAGSHGFPCGFVSTNDPLGGVLSADPTHQFGTLRAGPLVVDDASPGPSRATPAEGTLHCWIQVNSDSPDHFPRATAHCDFDGAGVIAGACQIHYSAQATDDVHLCAMLETRDGTHVYDDDVATDGSQCSLAAWVDYGIVVG